MSYASCIERLDANELNEGLLELSLEFPFPLDELDDPDELDDELDEPDELDDELDELELESVLDLEDPDDDPEESRDDPLLSDDPPLLDELELLELESDDPLSRLVSARDWWRAVVVRGVAARYWCRDGSWNC